MAGKGGVVLIAFYYEKTFRDRGSGFVGLRQ